MRRRRDDPRRCNSGRCRPSCGVGEMSPPWPWRTNSLELCGLCGCSNAHSQPITGSGNRVDCRSPGGLHRAYRIRAHRSDRRGGYADNSAGHKGSCKRLAPRARMSMMARSRTTPRTRPKIRLQSDPRAQLWDDNSHGAPRASRPCGRLRRCAARSLDPCSRRGLNAPMRRRQTFVAILNERTYRIPSLDAFYLTEESRYAC